MIAAVCFRINEYCNAKLYQVGTYANIKWESPEASELGSDYTVYSCREDAGIKPAIFIKKGLDDRYILRLVETKRYVMKLEAPADNSISLPHFQNEGNKYLKCDKDKDSISFQYINYLGRSKITFENHPEDRILSFEVVPDKMNYEDDYISLTESLAEICSELLLEFSGSTSNTYKQTEDDQKTLLERFIFLRQFCYGQNLQGLFEAIKRNPDRILASEDEFKPIGQGKPSKKFYTNPFSYGKMWGRINEGNVAFLPQMVAVTRKHDSLDTAANRFIKFSLEKFDQICEQLINILDDQSMSKQAECLQEAKAIHSMLENVFKDEFFDEVGRLDIMPQNNQVLQKREGYAQIFAAYSMIDMALQLDWKGKDNIYEGESKNVALLYEYWLFFELFKIIRSIEGCELAKSEKDSFLDISDEITISLKEGKKSCQSFEIKRLATKINLYYNRTFSPKEFITTQYEGSYSRPFRPDYTIAIFPSAFAKGSYNGEGEAIANGAVSYIHFDAKYRITDLTSFVGKSEDFEEDVIFEDKAGSIVNTYQRGDLLKMHTYNDAIRRTVGSYVLYPGSGNINEGQCTTFNLYDEILPGVGAFAIKPSIDVAGENELRKFIVQLIEAKKKTNSRLNRLKYYAEMVLREPGAKKMDASTSEKPTVKLTSEKGSSCVIGYIKAEEKEDYYYQLKEKGLLTKGAEFIFYFYAIKGSSVYSHHQDIFKTSDFRFYINDMTVDGEYRLEPILCKIGNNELLSKQELVDRLTKKGFITDETKHHADFYYALTVKVIDDGVSVDTLKIRDVNSQNGNDTFSPHSPKVIIY